MQMQDRVPSRVAGVKRVALGALAGLALLSGSVAAAQPAAAGPLEPYAELFRPGVGSRYTDLTLPASRDLWTKTYRETIAVGHNFGPSPKDEGCNADARAAGYAYGQSYLKNWWVRFEYNGLNFISVEVTCRAYRNADTGPVVR
jgi:hypothetical protein